MQHGCSGLPTRETRWAAPRMRRTIWPVVLVAVVATLLAGCGDERSADAPATSASVAAVIKPPADRFFAAPRDGLVATARRHKIGITVSAAVGLPDATAQAAALESLAGGHAACFVLNPIDRTNLVQSLPAIPGDAPIIVVDTPIDRAAATALGVQITAYIGTDNVAAGRLAAEAMTRFVRPGAHVALVTGIPGDAASPARTLGFTRGARGRFDRRGARGRQARDAGGDRRPVSLHDG